VRSSKHEQSSGSRSANLAVTDNAPGSPHSTALSGAGIVASSSFSLRGISSELAALTNGAAVTPSSAAVGLAGKVVVRGAGSVAYSPVVNGDGLTFHNGGSQNTDTAFLAFSGAPISTLFNNQQPGDVSFTLKSSYSFANRLLVGGSRGDRYVFQVDDGTQTQSFFSISTAGSYLSFRFSLTAQTTVIYYVPKGQEDAVFGNGVVAGIHLTWDGAHVNMQVNGVTVASLAYSAMTPTWSSSASFTIGATSLNSYGGGYMACDDSLADFVIK